jgi:membrane protease YdiL (CAAX protease family)
VNQPVASAGHTASVLAILGGFAGWGAFNASRLRVTGGNHHLALYLQTLAFEWLLLGFILWGVRRHGTPLSAVLGNRWSSAGEFFGDLRIAGAYWFASLIALGILSRLLGITDQRETVRFLLPRGPFEMALWVALSVTAGICEEAVFRGYLQRQFLALTSYAPLAITLSAAIFGAGHIYQGYRGAILITVYGAMFGTLAQWRKSVRPGMLAHTWQDTVSGILGSLVRA